MAVVLDIDETDVQHMGANSGELSFCINKVLHAIDVSVGGRKLKKPCMALSCCLLRVSTPSCGNIRQMNTMPEGSRKDKQRKCSEVCDVLSVFFGKKFTKQL